MDEKKFLDVTNDMVEDIIKDVQAIVNRYAQTHGMEDSMHCFGSALSIAGGNMLSMLCFGLADPKQRSPFINKFFVLLRESAEAHKTRTMEKQH